MNRAMPPEMQLSKTRAVDRKHPSLPPLLRAAQYDLLIQEERFAGKLIDVIPAMMARETIQAMRKTKTALKECDIKPLIYSLNGKDRHIYGTLVLTERESCKPGMLMEALCREAGIEEEVRVLITRTGLLGENENGQLVPLETL